MKLYRLKPLAILTVFTLIVIALPGCSSTSTVSDSSSALSSTAIASKSPSSATLNKSSKTDDGWYYYFNNRDSSDMGKLYRSKPGGKNTMKVVDTRVDGNFTVYNNWVYYSDFDNGGIYKIKGDGTAKKKISNCSGTSVKVYGNYLYLSYSSGDAPNDGCDYIYRMALDGTGLKKICRDPQMKFAVDNGHIYYNNYNDSYRLYCINIDGSGKKKITQDSNIQCFVVGKNKIYYIRQADTESDGLIRSINFNGTDNSAVGTDKTHQIAYSGGKIYYLATNNDVYRLNSNGTGKTKVSPYSWEVVKAFGENQG